MVPIPGTKRRTYLEENVAAADLELSAEDIAAHRGRGRRAAAVAGERYPEQMMRLVNALTRAGGHGHVSAAVARTIRSALFCTQPQRFAFGT